VPVWLAASIAPCPLQEIAALTVQQEQLARRAEATQQRRDAMLAQAAALKEAAAGTEGQLAGLQEAVDKLVAEVGGRGCGVLGSVEMPANPANKPSIPLSPLALLLVDSTSLPWVPALYKMQPPMHCPLLLSVALL
jgi:hypothetical protein